MTNQVDKKYFRHDNKSVSVADTLTTIFEKNIQTVGRIFINFTVADYALDQFAVAVRSNPEASYDVLFSSSADYVTPTGILVGTSGDLTIVAAGSSGWLIMDTDSIESVRIQAASSNALGSTVSVFAGAN